MSAQIPQRSAPSKPRRSALSGVLGLLGFSALAGLLVTVSVTPAVALTGITASSTIGIFDSLPEYIDIGNQPERNEIYAKITGGESGWGDQQGYGLIATVYDQNRLEVPIDQMSENVLHAVVDGEDHRFFDHGGVDIQSVVRAAVGNVVAGDITSGSSTLTMQLVKNINVQQALQEETEADREAAYAEATSPSFDRKLKEMKLAIGLEKRYTKDEILAAYLNTVFFADNTYGIQAASQRYFGIDAKDLSIVQAASLVAIVQYPNERGLDNPENYAANQERRDYILDSMLTAGHITQAEHDEAVAVEVNDEFLNPKPQENGCRNAYEMAKWFCDFVVKNVKNFPQLGATEEERLANWAIGGYKLFTTLDLDIQTVAQTQIWANVPNDGRTGISLGSTQVSVQPGTGKILTMAENMFFDDAPDAPGGASAVNYNTSFDYGGSSGFQSGSTYKLFTLLEWLDTGHGLGDRVLGTARPVPMNKFRDRCNGGTLGGAPYEFGNDSGEAGVLDVMSATAGSVNGAFVSMATQLDLCDIKDMAVALGVERADGTPLQTNPSSVLGTNEITPLSLAGAYAAVAAQGLYCKPIMLEQVIDPKGQELGGQAPDCKQAVAPDVANTAAYALAGVMSGGTGSASNPGDGIPIIGKTGTTDRGVDTWIAAATTSVASVVWVGNSIGKISMSNWTTDSGISGRIIRHYIQSAVMSAFDNKYSGGAFPGPSDALLGGSAGIPIPDVIGRSPEEAKTIIENLGFEFANGGQTDSNQPAGTVGGVDPGVGANGAIGQVVTIYISKGNQKTVPDAVSGVDSYNEAKQIMQSAGFNNVHQSCVVVTDPLEVDKPQSQDPPAGTSAVPNTSITIVIGKLTC